jgi:hypothetical protein
MPFGFSRVAVAEVSAVVVVSVASVVAAVSVALDVLDAVAVSLGNPVSKIEILYARMCDPCVDHLTHAQGLFVSQSCSP